MIRTLIALLLALSLAACSGTDRKAGDAPPSESPSSSPSESPSESPSDTLEYKGPTQAQLNARCAMLSAEFLNAHATAAFEGTVTEITDGQVSIEVKVWYRGGEAANVHVTAPSADMEALIGAVHFEQGKDYLVAIGEGDTVLPCGLSAPATKKHRGLFRAAFQG